MSGMIRRLFCWLFVGKPTLVGKRPYIPGRPTVSYRERVDSRVDARENWLASLDPGIAHYVDVLDAAGVETFESCEGGEGHSFPEPTVRFYGGRSEGFYALSVAMLRGLPVKAIRRYWRVDHEGPEGPQWEMVFSQAGLLS